MLVKLLALVGAGLLLAGCASQNGEDLLGTGPLPVPACDTSPVTYALTIAPLLQQNCSSCHNSGLASGGLNVGSYAQVKNVAANGQLLGTVGHEPGFPAMPQGGAKLSDCAIGQLRQWVAAGSPNN